VPVTHVDHGIFRRTLRLTVEDVGDGGNGIKLELLIGVELKLHSVFSAVPTQYPLPE
jgi:hypothetical protein